MYFKNIVAAVGHTPLVELSHLQPNPGVHLLAKLEGQNPGGSGSIKDRIAYYMLRQAEEEGRLSTKQVILEATSGNTGIALAWLGKMKGYPVSIVMPESMSLERRQLLKIYGAEVILSDAREGMDGAIKLVRKMASEDNRYFVPDQFSNMANPLCHYETTAVEILEDLPYPRVDGFVAGIGTGGTITGISRRFKETFPGLKVVGVEPPPGDNLEGLRNLKNYLPPIIDLTLIDERVTVTSSQASTAARSLLNREGIFAGLSSGAAIYASLQLAAQMQAGTIVVILPDGGWKYLSTNLWQNI